MPAPAPGIDWLARTPAWLALALSVWLAVRQYVRERPSVSVGTEWRDQQDRPLSVVGDDPPPRSAWLRATAVSTSSTPIRIVSMQVVFATGMKPLFDAAGRGDNLPADLTRGQQVSRSYDPLPMQTLSAGCKRVRVVAKSSEGQEFRSAWVTLPDME